MSTLTAKRLLAHLESMTHERERPLLEVALASALRDLLGADRVSVYKLAQAPGESFVWPAVVVGAKGAQVRDDGVSVPEEMVSIERFPRLQACLESGTQQAAGNSSIFPLLKASGACFGFVEIEGRAVDSGQIELAERLQAIFMNMLALLDYSEVDTLTGLLNRKTFDEYLLRILSSLSGVGDTHFEALHVPHRRQAQPEGLDHWLAVVDIDHFKRVNDNFGHLIGDEVLLLVATMMKNSFRTHDKLFRFGGEEFIVLLKPNTADDAQRIFDRFRAGIEARDFPQVGHVTVSVGYAGIRPGDQPSVILDNADNALYWAKENGRNRVASYPALLAEGKLADKEAATSEMELF
jgi:diguanylate cyclase (GGDEF)-like protein